MHWPSSRVYDTTRQRTSDIVGDSDLLYFKDDAYYFSEGGEGDGDYSFTIDDPSGRYVFDIQQRRPMSDHLFVGHLVNDASAADFSAEAVAAEVALAYLEASSQARNVIMTPFGPAPITAYVTTRPVRAGEEFLASYGLDYWLSKVHEFVCLVFVY
jgi:hypothetical protein